MAIISPPFKVSSPLSLSHNTSTPVSLHYSRLFTREVGISPRELTGAYILWYLKIKLRYLLK